MFKLSLFLLLILLSIGCGTRYGYLSKVRAHPRELIPPKDKQIPSIDKDSEKINEVLTSSTDKLPSIISMPLPALLEVKSDTINSYVNTHQPDKKKNKLSFREKEKSTINRYVKWALVLGIIGLFSYPLVLPSAVGAVLLYSSIKALKQISQTPQRGKGIAIFGLVVGVLTTALFLLFIVWVAIEIGLLTTLILLLIAISINLFLYLWLKSQNANAIFEKPKEKPREGNNQKPRWISRIIVETLIATAILFVIAIISGGIYFPEALVWLGFLLALVFDYAMHKSMKKKVPNKGNFENPRDSFKEKEPKGVNNTPLRKWIVISLLCLLLAIPMFQLTGILFFLILGAVSCPVILILSRKVLKSLAEGENALLYRITFFIGIVTTIVIIFSLGYALILAIGFGVI